MICLPQATVMPYVLREAVVGLPYGPLTPGGGLPCGDSAQPPYVILSEAKDLPALCCSEILRRSKRLLRMT